jgi:hypothetical protein
MAISDAVKLKVYNEAAALLKEARFASLTETRELRYRFDDAWDAQPGVVIRALEKGQWHFAERTSETTYDPDITPSFGYTYAIEKPSDLVRLTGICSDEFLKHTIDYRDAGAHWLCNLDTVYLGYVSSDGSYGFDPTLWPASFSEVVEATLALKGAPTTASEEVIERVTFQLNRALADAVSRNAMASPQKFSPPGSWARSRAGADRKFDPIRR